MRRDSSLKVGWGTQACAQIPHRNDQRLLAAAVREAGLAAALRSALAVAGDDLLRLDFDLRSPAIAPGTSGLLLAFAALLRLVDAALLFASVAHDIFLWFGHKCVRRLAQNHSPGSCIEPSLIRFGLSIESRVCKPLLRAAASNEVSRCWLASAVDRNAHRLLDVVAGNRAQLAEAGNEQTTGGRADVECVERLGAFRQTGQVAHDGALDLLEAVPGEPQLLQTRKVFAIDIAADDQNLSNACDDAFGSPVLLVVEIDENEGRFLVHAISPFLADSRSTSCLP